MHHRSIVSLVFCAGHALAQSFPPPPFPAGNAPTPDRIALGKALFWDEQLSSTRSVACGSCHILSHGGADPRAAGALHPGPDGVFGSADDRHASPGVPANNGNGAYGWVPGFGSAPQVTPRRAPSVVNAAYLTALFWDGRAEGGVFRDPVTNQVVLAADAQLENLIAMPPVDTVEMGHPGRTWSDVVARVQVVEPLVLASNLPAPLQSFVAGRTYPQLFQQAYGGPVDAARIVMAIASYLRTLVSDQSPVDLFFAQATPLPTAAFNGLMTFASSCRVCHADFPAFSGPSTIEFRNTGVRPIAEDRGRGAHSGLTADDGKFKVPDLRNVALRAPFFHNGGMATLSDVLDFYNRGGDFHVNQDAAVAALANQLSPLQRTEIVAFLNALTDPRVANETPPFDRPRLFHEGPNAIAAFGGATPGSGGFAPRAIAVEPPRLGTPMVTLAVDSATPGQLAVLAIDLTAASTPIVVAGVSVHLALSPNLVLVTVGTLAGSTPGSGHGASGFAIPAIPALSGFTFFGQWVTTDPGTASGLAASGAFRLRLF